MQFRGEQLVFSARPTIDRIINLTWTSVAGNHPISADLNAVKLNDMK